MFDRLDKTPNLRFLGLNNAVCVTNRGRSIEPSSWITNRDNQYINVTGSSIPVQNIFLTGEGHLPVEKKHEWTDNLTFRYMFERENRVPERVHIRTRFGQAEININGQYKPQSVVFLPSDELKNELRKEFGEEGSFNEVKGTVDCLGLVKVTTETGLLSGLAETLLQLVITEFNACNPGNMRSIAPQVYKMP